MMSQVLSRALIVIVLMQFKQNLGASTLDPLQQRTETLPIRHSRSRVYRHLHALAGGGGGTILSANTSEPFVSLGAKINNAQLPFNYANDYQKASLSRTLVTVENFKLPTNLTHTTATTLLGGEAALHKIRKLHKKQLMENIHNTVHHRSLIEAEQLSERQTSQIVDKLFTKPVVAVADGNFMYFNDQSYGAHTNYTQINNFEILTTTTATKPNKNTITKLYLVDKYDKSRANLKLKTQKEINSAQITVEDQQSISAADSNVLNDISVGDGVEDENNNINIDRNFSLLEQQNETDSELSSPQTISAERQTQTVEKEIQNKEDLTLDFMWNENDTYAPSMFASTSLDEEFATEQQQQQQQSAALLPFDLPENNLKSITLVDKPDETTATADYTLIDNHHVNGFPLESDENVLSVASEDEEPIEPNQLLEGVIDAANEDEIYDWDEISRNNRRNLMRGRDVVTKFLQIVETQHSLGSNCEAGTSLNLGEGVVDRYAQDRFRVEAEVAVNRANMLTRIFKMTSPSVQADVNLLHASVLSMVEFDDDIFAAGNCFDWNEHPSQPGLFCPFAYRLPPPHLGAIIAKDLANEYHYLGNTSEWFFQARKNAEKVIAKNEQYAKAFHLYSNKTDERIEDDTLTVKYEDGRWSKPYYDCGGGNIWMLTYTVPFFGYENGTYHFKGTSGIDIDLRRVDIDQCPQRNTPGTTQPLNIFAGTDKCKQRTTMCHAIKGLGFRRGSYKCVCRKGYFFPDITTTSRFFNGSLLEEEYEKLMLGKNSSYNINNEYECLPCAEGCDSCEDRSPCIAALNWPMRTSILVLACTVIGLLPPAAWFTFRYQQVKVVRAASPALLRVIALGAFFIYCTNVVMYPNPNLYTCTARIWLREIGFSLTYGALMLKTWRISVIFRVRSAKAVKITDAALLKRLGIICAVIGTCLLVRTLVAPPDVVVKRTADDLKAFLCKTDWWDYTFTSMEVSFLAWGVRLCIMVRKAPSEFNESRFISMAIYNEFLLTCFLNVSMFFLQSPANPDLLYIIFFCHTQLTVTLLLCLIFGSKVYIVLRSGKSHQDSVGMVKGTTTKFNFRPQVRTFTNSNTLTSSSMQGIVGSGTTSAETKLSDQEALDEIRQLSARLQRIQEMAPPKGVAVMTISSLLDGLRTPGSVMLVAAAANSAVTQTSTCEQLAVVQQSLPLLADMQKYQATRNNNTLTTNTTTSPTNIVSKSSKALNTDLSTISGNNEPLPAGYVICSHCLTLSKDSMLQKMATCQELGSPQTEGSISFSKLKLDCMCSVSEDLNQYQSKTRLNEEEEASSYGSISRTPSRRKQMRSAATNTPPLPMSIRCHDCNKLSSSRSLQGKSSLNAHQICDNCKKRFRCSTINSNNNSNTKTKRKTQKRLIGSGLLNNKRQKASTCESGKTSEGKMHSTNDIVFYASSSSLSKSASNSQSSLSSSECTVTRGLTKERFTKSEIILNVESTNKLPQSSIKSTASAAVSMCIDVDIETVVDCAEKLPNDPESNKTNGQTGALAQTKRPDKLMLDLNDRSKFTKEVSV